MLKTFTVVGIIYLGAYHLGEGRVLKTLLHVDATQALAYHLGEGRVLKTNDGECKPYV